MLLAESRTSIRVGATRLGWLNWGAILGSDLCALSLAYWTSVLVRYLVIPDYQLSFYLGLYPVVTVFLVAFFANDLYPGVLIHPAEEIRKVSLSVTAGLLLIGSATFMSRGAAAYSRSVFLVAWALGIPAVLLCRYVFRNVLARFSWWGVPAVVLGSGAAARHVMDVLHDRSLGIRVVGFFTDDPQFPGELDTPPFLGELALTSTVVDHNVPYVIVVMPEKPPMALVEVIQSHCEGFKHILLMPDLLGTHSLGATVRNVGGELGIEMQQQLFHRLPRAIKRGLDIVCSLIGLLLLLPLLGFIALVIAATSRGPVFYGHPRFGHRGSVFKAWKFRSMVQNGDEVLAEYFRTRPDEERYWRLEHKLRDDPRVTSVGRFLRRWSLDELPQLWNALVGDMSLVGPRPIVPNEIDDYADRFAICTSVRPGITGLWQVSGRNTLSFTDRIRLNEYYIRNWSVWLDAFILCKTVTTVLKREGAY